MPDRETWRFLNTFAPWLSALGTLAAVITSLYLARRAARLDIRVSASIVRMGVPGQQPWHEYFKIRVVNHGREAVVIAVAWWLRFNWLAGTGLPKNWLVLTGPDDDYSTRLPARLDFGEEANFFLATDVFFKPSSDILKTIRSSRFRKLTLRLLRVGVSTSTGQKFRAPLDVYVRKFLLERSTRVSNEAHAFPGIPPT